MDTVGIIGYSAMAVLQQKRPSNSAIASFPIMRDKLAAYLTVRLRRQETGLFNGYTPRHQNIPDSPENAMQMHK